MAQYNLDRVSLTGADDNVAPDELIYITRQYPFVEWGLLYVPHNEGAPRNPTKDWRVSLFDNLVLHNEHDTANNVAVHLCGSLAFEELLDNRLPEDLLRAGRLQLNVNARKKDFSYTQVMKIYEKAMFLGPDLILQYHENVHEALMDFVSHSTVEERKKIHVLFDDSRGTGKRTLNWSYPESLYRQFHGYAGGLSPDNIDEVVNQLNKLNDKPYWVDMESGIRTGNQFDIAKVLKVLLACEPFVSHLY